MSDFIKNEMLYFSSENTMAALFTHFELTKKLIEISREDRREGDEWVDGYFSLNDLNSEIKEYTKKMEAINWGGTEKSNISMMKYSLNRGFQIKSLKGTKQINEKGDDRFVFNTKFLDMVELLNLGSGNCFSGTVSMEEFKEYKGVFNTLAVNVYQKSAELSRKVPVEDLEDQLKRRIDSFTEMIYENTDRIEEAIVSFGSEESKGESSVARKEANARRLLNDRVLPFEVFLQKESSGKESARVEIRELMKKLKSTKSEVGERYYKRLNGTLSLMSDTLNEIIQKRKRLNEIVNSSKERLTMIEMSSKNLKNLEKEFDNVFGGGKDRNRRVGRLKTVESFDILQDADLRSDLKDNDRVTIKTSKEVNKLTQNVMEIIKNYSELEISSSTLSEEKVLEIKKEREAERKRSIIERQKIELERDIDKYKKEFKKEYKNIIFDTNVDVYEKLYRRLNELCINRGAVVTFNMLNSLALAYVNGFLSEKECLYRVSKKRKKIEELNMSYPVFEFYELKRGKRK